MANPDADIVTLLRFDPSTVVWIRRAGFVVAVVVVALSWWANRSGWFEYQPGGTEFTMSIRPIVIGVFLVGAVVALRFEMAGSIICAFAAAALVAFAERQLIASHAVIVVAALAVPALLWLIVDLNRYAQSTAFIGLGLIAAAVVGGFGLGQYVYEYFWGPTHPESTITELPESDVEWAWSGAVTDSSARVTLKISVNGSVRLLVADGPDVSAGRALDPDVSTGRGFDPDDADEAIATF